MTAHKARASMNVPGPPFSARLILVFPEIPWSPRFPDLSVSDYFWWVNLRTLVYAHMPRSFDDLKETIWEEVATIDRIIPERADAQFQKHLQKGNDGNRHHMMDVVFCTWFWEMLIQYKPIEFTKLWLHLKLMVFFNFDPLCATLYLYLQRSNRWQCIQFVPDSLSNKY